VADAPGEFAVAVVGSDEREEGGDADAACDAEETGVVVEGGLGWLEDGACVGCFDEDGEGGAGAEEGGCSRMGADDE
jgi:hypothetical protein